LERLKLIPDIFCYLLFSSSYRIHIVSYSLLA